MAPSRQVTVFVFCAVFLAFSSARSYVNSDKTLEQKMREDVDLSQFYSLLENNPIANTTLTYRSVTVFAPANLAFQKYTGKVDDTLVLYHMTNSAQNLNQLGYYVSSELEGNPPLWITRQRTGVKDEIFVNNAKVLSQRSNLVYTNLNGRKQVLHIIEDVLEPVRSTNPDAPLYNPDAWTFLNQSENIELDSHRIRSFRQRVQLMKKADIFKAEGRYTFFIPVDEGFQPPPRPEKIDEKVIDGHVIPREVLFTNAAQEEVEHETLAFTDMMKVTISFKTEHSLKGSKTYVKSHTIVGDANHAEGVVLAEIVKANIPVKNGVVHLIHRPLMVVDTTVTQFLESFKGFDREDGPLYKFYEVIRDTEGDFMDRITRMRDLTLFAPSNAAWLDSNLNNLMRDRSRIREILNMHLVEQRLTMDQIIQSNTNKHPLFKVPTLAPRKSLYFNVVHQGHNKTLTVEGGGVNATVIQPDIAATNGIVHIIDRVLGVPFTTVGRKLATDPMLNKTYQLGKTNNFNIQLDDTSKKFTYFVPRDFAWNRMEARFPSAHKKMFMKDYGYHILERHLVVDDKPLTMQMLKKYSNESLTLPTIRDVLKLRVKESDSIQDPELQSLDGGYYIEWNNEWIHVFRPDVECTNGVIHVIDSVLLQDSDIVVSAAPTPSLSLGLGTAAALFLSLLAAHLL
ncbi:fasciclin-1 isoform X3 [Homalodisca vitripennis]|uniref:fasciclin-1 isoform X3 n=1 Tax=Homalodisca vitripennis TaxID=197043 RepID=UPI001EE9E834|nr:fasciclin-1 isoform X3 [Homalodisca vitripennis]